jgi:hypothetical protein
VTGKTNVVASRTSRWNFAITSMRSLFLAGTSSRLKG